MASAYSTSPMRATGPAARAAHATNEFGEGFFDADVARFGFFAGGDPANPFVARERRDVRPRRSGRAVSRQRFPPVRRHFMHRASENFLGHEFIRKNWLAVWDCIRTELLINQSNFVN